MGDLYRKLREYSDSDYYPYHMPGHKRRLYTEAIASAAWDITEIDGFDNLHDAAGILRQLQEKAADAYGAEESFFLINGSTAGILTAVSAAVEEAGELLMVRNCHKSAYHAAYLRNLNIKYIWPEIHPEFGCSMAVTATQVEEALLSAPQAKAVLIVSPTYEGFVAEIEQIAEVVHKRGIPLIVDEAHGAHLGFHSAFRENSNRLGADIVIHSLHKTLPSLTQTGVLHVNGTRIDRTKLRKFLSIYQSSSPSYILMAGMEEAIEMAVSDAEKLFGFFWLSFNRMTNSLSACRNIRILQEKNMDIGKLVIADRTGNLSGKQLYDILLERYHLQMEMAAGGYVLAMFTVGDTREGYERLTQALLEIDGEISLRYPESHDAAEKKYESIRKEEKPGQKMRLAAAWDKKADFVLLDDAEGRIAAEFINLYPPASPLLAPGEVFTRQICRNIDRYAGDGLTVQGIDNRAGQIYVKVV